jgi:2-phospho-L-lactate guanylyltransferase (CobY/MobA/RfbA family)
VDVLDTGATSDLVVVPSRADGGTNALYMTPPDLIEPQFGPGSLAAHVREAEERKLRCSILPLERLVLDIDTIEDVDAFVQVTESGQGGRTGELLRQLR